LSYIRKIAQHDEIVCLTSLDNDGRQLQTSRPGQIRLGRLASTRIPIGSTIVSSVALIKRFVKSLSCLDSRECARKSIRFSRFTLCALTGLISDQRLISIDRLLIEGPRLIRMIRPSFTCSFIAIQDWTTCLSDKLLGFINTKNFAHEHLTQARSAGFDRRQSRPSVVNTPLERNHPSLQSSH
jgi:hypothetical protein